MGDLLATSVSGLIAFQQALDVTSNNIANVATPGYDAETANFNEQAGQGSSAGYIGNGVDVQSVTRAYNGILTQQVNASQSSYSSFDTLATEAAQIDGMLSGSSTGLTATLQSFVGSLQTLSTSPASAASGQAVLSQAQVLTRQLQSYDTQISGAGTQLESQIGTTVNQINELAGQIASLNGQIASESGAGQTPNILMDQRDQLVSQLSHYVSVNTVAQANGAANVYIGSGQALVTDDTSQHLTTIPSPYDATVSDIGLVAAGGATDITSEVSGGSLGGLLSARSQVLDPARNAIGRLSVGIATLMNQQQQVGMDLTGSQGQPMFAVGGVGVHADTGNTDATSLTATRSNLSGLTTGDYELAYRGGAWSLTDVTTGQSASFTGSGTAADPFEFAGVSVIVNGAGAGGSVANGDSFLVQPTANATAGLSLLLTSPSQVASASLIQGTPGATNTGSGTVASALITDPASWTMGTYTVSFSSPTAYTVTNSAGTTIASGAYTSGTPIAFAGAALTLTGTPAAGDTFAVSRNSAANTGDNSNALAMISQLSAATLAGGTLSLSDAANNLVSQIGTITQQAQSNASAAQSVNQSAGDALSNASGVNLDEEAALMVRYQQAYQACAQLIQASDTMFKSLISAIS